MAPECASKCLACGNCASDHGGWDHPWTGDLELLLAAASEGIKQHWRGNAKTSAIAEAVGELGMDLLNERWSRGRES